MTEREAGEFLEEIEENIYELLECREVEHNDEMSHDGKMSRLTVIPEEMLKSWNLYDMVSQRNLNVEKSTTDDNGEVPNSSKKEEGQPIAHISQEEVEELNLGDSDVVISAGEFEASKQEMPPI